MRIQVNDRVRIEDDDHNWTIKRLLTSAKGKQSWKLVGYYPSIGLACERLLLSKTGLLIDPAAITCLEYLRATIVLEAAELRKVTASAMAEEIAHLQELTDAQAAALADANERIRELERKALETP